MEKIFFENIVKQAIKRILEVVQPKRIILFGSAARGKIHANSDIDLLVVIPSGMHRRNTAQKIYRNLVGLGYAADIVVVTEDDVERFKDNSGMIIQPALKEGKL